MKKLSSVQQKQQTLVLDVVNTLEQQALLEIAGMQQCWFSMEYNAFPGSLLVRLQFDTEQTLAAAAPQLGLWQKRLSVMLLKRGVVLKKQQGHLVFTLQGPTA